MLTFYYSFFFIRVRDTSCNNPSLTLLLSQLQVKYRRADNTLVLFADDQTPRLTSAFCPLDYDTVSTVFEAPCPK